MGHGEFSFSFAFHSRACLSRLRLPDFFLVSTALCARRPFVGFSRFPKIDLDPPQVGVAGAGGEFEGDFDLIGIDSFYWGEPFAPVARRLAAFLAVLMAELAHDLARPSHGESHHQVGWLPVTHRHATHGNRLLEAEAKVQRRIW